MSKPESYNPEVMYRVSLSAPIRLADGHVIRMPKMKKEGNKLIELGSVKLRGDLCQQFDDKILSAEEV